MGRKRGDRSNPRRRGFEHLFEASTRPNATKNVSKSDSKVSIPHLGDGYYEPVSKKSEGFISC